MKTWLWRQSPICRGGIGRQAARFQDAAIETAQRGGYDGQPWKIGSVKLSTVPQRLAWGMLVLGAPADILVAEGIAATAAEAPARGSSYNSRLVGTYYSSPTFSQTWYADNCPTETNLLHQPTQPDIAFKVFDSGSPAHAELPIRLDEWAPPDSGSHPALFLVHGGGWFYGCGRSLATEA